MPAWANAFARRARDDGAVGIDLNLDAVVVGGVADSRTGRHTWLGQVQENEDWKLYIVDIAVW